MSSPDSNFNSLGYPERISIIGGGRWGREIVQALSEIAPQSTVLSLHSWHNFSLNKIWLREQNLSDRVDLVSDWPIFDSSTTNIAVVANAAQDHANAVTKTLLAGVPTLVEKPFTLSTLASEGLIRLAQKTKTQLSTANVFTFARYVQRFSSFIPCLSDIDLICVDWADPQKERRHSQDKYFDSSLPIVSDLLPHIVSILYYLLPGSDFSVTDTQVSNAGAQVELNLRVGRIPCNVTLSRNDTSRRRIFTIITNEIDLQLDFSQEPGVIRKGPTVIMADPEWHTKRHPLADMLNSFASGDTFYTADPRFDPSIGLMFNNLLDKVLPRYRTAQVSWLLKHLSENELPSKKDLRYVLIELLESRKTISDNELELHYSHLMQFLTHHEQFRQSDKIPNESTWCQLSQKTARYHDIISHD